MSEGTIPASLPLRNDLIGEEPYGAPQLDVPVCLNVNENPYPPSHAVVRSIEKRVREAAAGLNRYPDREHMELRQAFVDYLAKESQADLTTDEVWGANGSNEIMLQLFQAFGGPGRNAIGCDPTYSMYPEYARDTFTTWNTAPRRADFTLDVDATIAAIDANEPSMVVLTSPNNPTGTPLPMPDLERILDHCQNARVAGAAFAGARVGYIAASKGIIDCLRIVRMPYHLSAVTQAAALAGFDHTDEQLSQVGHLRETREATAAWLREQTYAGKPLEVAPSQSNFLMFGGHFDDRGAIFDEMLERGVLIRVVGPEGWLRVCMGTDEEMKVFRKTLVESMRAVEARAATR